MMKFILILMIAMSPAYAIEVTPIKKGQPATKDGFVVSKDDMQKLRKLNEKKKLLERENLNLKDLNVINEKRVNVYEERYNASEKELTREKTKSNLKGIGGFVLGVVVTGFIGYAAVRASR